MEHGIEAKASPRPRPSRAYVNLTSKGGDIEPEPEYEGNNKEIELPKFSHESSYLS